MRFVPPHLLLLVSLLIFVLWVMLVHRFRNSTGMQQFFSELFGDNTPENALRTYQLAKQRLANHLNDAGLDGQMRQKIESALSEGPGNPPMESHADIRP